MSSSKESHHEFVPKIDQLCAWEIFHVQARFLFLNKSGCAYLHLTYVVSLLTASWQAAHAPETIDQHSQPLPWCTDLIHEHKYEHRWACARLQMTLHAC